MKIAYTNKILLSKLILGLFWIGLGIYYIFEGIESKLGICFTFGVGLLLILMFIYEYLNKYIRVTSDTIKVNTLPEKKINLRELIRVDCYTDDYIFVASNRRLRIEKSRINKKDLPKFEIFVNDVNSILKNRVY